MKRLLLDTNIVLDVLLNRQPWMQNSQLLWTKDVLGNSKPFNHAFVSAGLLKRSQFT